MPTLNIGNRSVQVDDSFLSLPPDQQNDTVDEIAQSLGGNQSAAPSPVGNLDKLGAVGQVANAIPVIGPLALKGVAAANAAIAPLVGEGGDKTFSERYAAEQQKEQADLAQLREQHPVESLGNSVLGATFGLGPIANTAKGAAALGFGSGGLIPNMARGALSGGAINAADAVARGEDPTTAAEWGAAFGAGGPATGKLVGAVARGVARPFRSAQTVAAEKVAEPLINEGLTSPQAVNTELGNIGPEATLLDVNPNLTSMGGAVAAKPGPGQVTMRDFIQDRASGAASRITNTADQVLGKPADIGALTDQIDSQAKTAVAPLYRQAYQTPIQTTPDLQDVLSSPLGKLAVSKAKPIALSDPNTAQSTMFKPPPIVQTVTVPPGSAATNIVAQLRAQGVSEPELAKMFSLPLSNTPSAIAVDVPGLHAVRQVYDDMISSAARQGLNNKVRILSAQRSVIDDSLKQVPEMAQADSIYSSKSGVTDALQNGLKIFSNTQTPESVAATLANAPIAERAAYQTGARTALRNVMGTARNDAGAARSVFAKDFNQEKLNTAFGQGAADAVMNRIAAENKYAAVGPRIVGNSETAARLEANAALQGSHGLPSYKEVGIFSGGHGMIRRAVAGAMESVWESVRSGRQENINAAVAKLLTAAGPDRDAAVQAVMNAARKVDPSGGINAVIAQAVARFPRPSEQHDDQPRAQLRAVRPSRR